MSNHSHELTLTVCVAPTSGLNLDHEASMLKPAMLYGDNVKLYSPKASLLSDLVGYSELDSIEQLVALVQMAEPLGLEVDMTQLNSVLVTYRMLKKLPKLSSAQKSALHKLESFLEGPSLNEIQQYFKNLAVDSGIRRLKDLARKSDLLEIQNYSSPESMLDDWLGSVLASVITGQETLVLDASTTNLMKSLDDFLGQRSVQDPGMDKAVAVAGNLFERLPTFSAASLDEILDIRRELNPYLGPFRTAILNLTDNIVSQQWDSGFNAEVERLAKERLDQHVCEIEEVSKASTALRRMLVATASNTSWPTILGCIVVDAVQMPNFLIQFLGIGGVLGAPATVVGLLKGAIKAIPHAKRALDEWKQEKLQLSRNRLYFYHRLKQRLK